MPFVLFYDFFAKRIAHNKCSFFCCICTVKKIQKTLHFFSRSEYFWNYPTILKCIHRYNIFKHLCEHTYSYCYAYFCMIYSYILQTSLECKKLQQHELGKTWTVITFHRLTNTRFNIIFHLAVLQKVPVLNSTNQILNSRLYTNKIFVLFI